MQSRRSISLLSVLLFLFAQLVSALPSPAARQLEARIAEPAAVDAVSQGWNYGDKKLNGDQYGDVKLDGDNDWDYGNSNNEHYGDESEHHERNAWEVLLQAHLDISAEVDIIKSYQQLTYDDCSKHIVVIRNHITRIHETIQVKYQAGTSWTDIFDGHDSEEIHAQIVIIINVITDLFNYFYSIGISLYISLLVDLCNDISVWLQYSSTVVVGLSASLSVSVSTFVGLSSNLGVSISL